MTSSKLTLHCKHKSGRSVLDSLTSDTTVEEFKATLYSVTNIQPQRLKVLIGFPPKAIDLNNDKLSLNQLEIRTGEMLIIEEKPASDIQNDIKSVETKQQTLLNNLDQEFIAQPPGILLRKVVPANNSCLFTSVDFNINGGKFNPASGIILRKVIAETVAKDTETFNEAVLGKPNKDYCHWILNDEHWGGAIELSILSKHFGLEIVAVDTQAAGIHRFGEDENYSKRILVIYDGIHYDPLIMESLHEDEENNIRTIFDTISEDYILKMALEIADEAKASRQFTDVSSFTLKCLVCNKNLTGQTEAQLHAKESGHINFGEF